MYKLLFIVTGPSGAGKNTVMTHIRRIFPEINKAVTYTTRYPRPHETDGIDYRFISEEQFFEKVKSGAILEYEQVYNDYYYGSPADIFGDGNIKIMEMDWKGHRKYREVHQGVRIVSLFLIPPSLEEIRKRILGRSQVDNLGSRIANALEQMEHAGEYSYIIINEHKEKMLAEVEAIVRVELLRLKRNRNLEIANSLLRQYNN
jgi:guanylate kinase